MVDLYVFRLATISTAAEMPFSITEMTLHYITTYNNCLLLLSHLLSGGEVVQWVEHWTCDQ